MGKIRFAFSIILILVLPVLLFGCSRVSSSVNGSGKIIDQDIKVTDFNRITIEGAFDVEIFRAPHYAVTISTDENLVNRVLVSRENKTLRLRIQAPSTFLPTQLKARIGLPAIESLSLSDMAKGGISGFTSAPYFYLFLKNGSSLNGSLEAEATHFNLSGASKVSLTGKSNKLNLDCSGSSKLDLSNFFLDSAVVKLRDTSEATLNVDGRFDVFLSDESKVYYLGNPFFGNTSVSSCSLMVHK